MENIKSLLEWYEKIKLKWFKVQENDILNLIYIWDKFEDIKWEIESEYSENNLELDNKKASKSILLKQKSYKDSLSWKMKNYTDNLIKDIIKEEFYNEDLDLLRKKATIKMLWSKIKTVEQYVQFFKKIVFKT